MKLVIALLLAGSLMLLAPLYASGWQNLAPWCVDRVSVGMSYHKPTFESSEAIIEPQTTTKYENPCSLQKYGKEGDKFKATVTAYNSVPEQTDSSPCLAADGSDICKSLARGERACAANCFPLGSVLDIPGIGRCVVRDRTATRFGSRVDVYFGGRDQIKAAREYGKKSLIITFIHTK